MNYQRVKGSYDIIPKSDEPWKEASAWHFLEKMVRTITKRYALEEIRTPIFEYTDLFIRTVGTETDIVSKEMYTFMDKGDRSLSLRPELTAPLLRAYIENGLTQVHPQRYYYMGPCFRYDRAQKGRYRQFTQFGIEILGEKDPAVDVETITCFLDLLQELNLQQFTLKINTIGDLSCRKEYALALQKHLFSHKSSLSEESKRRLTTNPLRILDSKEACDQALLEDAPILSDFISPSSLAHFEKVLSILTALSIPFQKEPRLVRGLDYYVDTVFEVVTRDDKGAQNALGGGGRYDGLVKQLGGPEVPAIGFGCGLERILQALVAEGKRPPKKEGPDYFIIPLSEEAKKRSFILAHRYRRLGKSVSLFLKNFHIKKGLQAAEQYGAKEAVIVGDEELGTGTVTIKNLTSREERKEKL